VKLQFVFVYCWA